ncbi:ABC transporter substrate-binding protein [Romboutsia sp. 1001713B170131_170501_G6]|uniref:ABC transporter substrate-binding protein n=1 Tax=Romboutsia sp. 1001713B170131_170501_G6 TaxID=2787108 RepID=UPI0018AB80F8|nr:ABC transporter substrate-binding protein [Romboutsia sp. 1001713B170131_170501_G6]
MKKKILSIIMAVTLVMLTVVGCSSKEVVIKDREGRDIKVPNKIDKIISTAPSNTEVLVELGLADKLVAVDKYSADVAGIPDNVELIDFSNPDAEKIIGLEPDIIVASGHNKTGSTEDPFKLVEEAGISVAYIPSSNSIQGIYDDITFISEVTNTKEKGKKIVENTKSQIEDIAKKGKDIKDKKKVYFEIGSSPNLFSFGNSTFLNEMIELVGAENILKDENAWISPSAETIIDKNPDVILTNDGYIENPVDKIKNREGWENINAVKNNQVYQIDTNSSSRPSQHIIKALNEMAKAIYPNVYNN